MPRNSSGSYTLPAGNPVTTNTTISSTWANGTLADLATETTNSLDRNGRGPMLAPLASADGSSTAPGLAFNAEPNSGIYRAGTNDVRLQVGGITTLQWLPTGLVAPLGLTATQSQSNTVALQGTGNGTASGIKGIGGTSNGAGLEGTGGGSSGAGVVATGGGSNGFGIVATGAGPSAGVHAIAGPSSTDAITCQGTITLTGPALSGAPNATVQDKSLTQANTVRVGGFFRTTGATGAQTILAGYNIASVTLAANKHDLQITFNGVTFSSTTSYWVLAFMSNNSATPGRILITLQATGSLTFNIIDNSGATLDLTTYAISGIHFEAKGF